MVKNDDASMVYSFDAIRGVQAGREFYVAMCPLKTIPKLFIFNDSELPPQLRAQRTLRAFRIPTISNYILENSKDYIFSSLTASVDGSMKFTPAPSLGESGSIGRLNISMNARMLINDGQHRRAAIEEALKHKPDLGIESISVVFFVDRGLKRSQQMFADLNKHAIKPTKSLGILYDHRDDFSRFVVDMVNTLDIFRNRTEMERTTISNRSVKFFTLNGVSDATKELLHIKKNGNVSPIQEKFAKEFWECVSKNIPEWNMLVKKKAVAFELRSEYVHAHTNTLSALGMVGHVLLQEYPTSWKKKLGILRDFDWARNNPEWEGTLAMDGKMMKNKRGVSKAANFILAKCNIQKQAKSVGK